MQQIMLELNDTASEEDSGKGPGDFSKHLQERQPDVVLLSHLKPNTVYLL